MGLLSYFYESLQGVDTMNKYLKALGCLFVVSMLSACSNTAKVDQEKIAVISWDKAVSGHLEYPRLQQGEKIVRSLVLRRDAQKDLAQSQMRSVQNLRALKQFSEKSYLDAELRTLLVEKEQINKARMFKKLREVETEVDEELAPKRKALEDEYRLRIFNLRMEKDRAKVDFRRRDNKNLEDIFADIDKQIDLLKNERDIKILSLNGTRQALISEKMEPFVKILREESQKLVDDKQRENLEKISNSEGKYDKLMAAAPDALEKALAVMDKEIDKQQEKNSSLKKKINSDIEGVVVKLAKERGYTIVFNTFKANVSADNITDNVIAELKKLKDK